MKPIIVVLLISLLNLLLTACTPAKVDFSGSQLNNLKYSFAAPDSASTSLALYANQSRTLDFKTSDKTTDSLSIKLSFEVLSSEKFSINDAFSNLSDSVLIPAGSNSFSITFTTKNLLPFSASSADIKVLLSSTDNSVNFSPSEFKVKLINSSPTEPTISFNALSYINSLNQSVYLISGTCSDITNFLITIESTAYPASCSAAGIWSLTPNLSSLAEGTFSVQAKDLGGTKTYQSSTVTKDSLAPTITSINDSVYHGSTDTSPLINWNNTDLGSGINNVEVALGTTTNSQDVKAWTSIGALSSYQFTGLHLTNGTKYFVQIRAKDNAGNTSTAVAGDGFIVDTSIPSLTISNAPPTYTNINSYNLNLSGTNVAQYSYKYGIASSTDCSSSSGYSPFINISTPLAVSASTEKQYKLCAIGKSNSGIAQPYSSANQMLWTYDISLPFLTITSPADGNYVNSSNQNLFTVNSNCSENGLPVHFYAYSATDPSKTLDITSTCSGSIATNGLDLSSFPNGDIKIKTYQSDAATNTGYSVYVTVHKDSNAPTFSGSITMSSSFNNLSESPSFSWSAGNDTGSGIKDYLYAIGSTPFSSNIRSWTSSGLTTNRIAGGLSLTNGQTYYVSVKAVDYAGNESNSLTQSWTVDMTLPSVAIISPTTTTYISSANQANLSVTVSCETGLNATLSTMSLVNSAYKDEQTVLCSSGLASKIFDLSNYPDGGIRISVSQTDNAGNTGNISNNYIKDTITPLFNSTINDGAYYNSLTASPDISWSPASDSNGIFKYQIAIGASAGANDKLDWTDIGNVTHYQILNGLDLANGNTYYPSLRAIDNAGNISFLRTGDGWIVDTSIPSTPTLENTNNQWSDPNLSPHISWSASSDTISGVSYYKIRLLDPANFEVIGWQNAGNNTNYQFGLSGASLIAGNIYQVEIKAVDAAGNESPSFKSNSWVQVDPGWKTESFVKAGNASDSYYFGKSIASYGDTMVVGSPDERSNQTTITNGSETSSDSSLSSAGAVYVYKRTWNATLWKYEWSQEAYIKAVNTSMDNNFGSSVAIYNDTIAVGANGEKSDQTTITNGSTASSVTTGFNVGAVYVYRKGASGWAQEAYIKAPNSHDSLEFGGSVTLNNDTLAVAALGDDSHDTIITNGSSASTDHLSVLAGAVYVFKRSGSNWNQEAYIKASNSKNYWQFGSSLALENDTLAVGAKSETSNQTFISNDSTSSTDTSLTGAGAVYVYRRTWNSTSSIYVWNQEAYLKAANTNSNYYFGSSVAIYQDTIAVGAYGEKSNQNFITNGSGASSNNSLSNAGAVYIYTRTPGIGWSQQAYLKPSNNTSGNLFGYSVAIGKDLVVVGSYGERSGQNYINNNSTASTDTSLSYVGAVYVFKRSSSTWTQAAYIKAPNPSANDNFGLKLSLYQNTLSVSATGEDSSQTVIQNIKSGFTFDDSKNNRGAVYVFKFD